ncbi:hypothetical protein SBA1_10044 [Candidatus Sulfotelmatobacter kueseliae]|uniref:Uncharacterized protein n=1 Tax=Candidatus Sulfotelmatobacter kueseliae TaxID=2042962 RepID=A0A2U3JVJ5_9BACT|nr:hypothetical protein SBA1_10044 [Candidatus Sulfotelmatobacter kueseliae]
MRTKPDATGSRILHNACTGNAERQLPVVSCRLSQTGLRSQVLGLARGGNNATLQVCESKDLIKCAADRFLKTQDLTPKDLLASE